MDMLVDMLSQMRSLQSSREEVLRVLFNLLLHRTFFFLNFQINLNLSKEKNTGCLTVVGEIISWSVIHISHFFFARMFKK